MRTLVRSVGLALAIAIVPLGAASAHECVVVNRSAAGNAHVTASANWITVSLEQLYGETELFGLPDLSAAQVAYARDLAMSWGVPASFTFRSDRTLLEEASGWQKNGHATDGKGIDHFFDVYGERILGALFAALQNA
jgi:hypothetical protein